MVNIAKMS